MMTEIYIIEGGQKRCLLTRGDQIKKKVTVSFDKLNNTIIERHAHLFTFL